MPNIIPRPARNDGTKRAHLQAILNNEVYTETMTRDETPLMINEFGMVINAVHTGEIGRGGYFPETSGTSEAQFLTMKTNALCYKITGKDSFKDRAQHLAFAALEVMYRRVNRDVPNYVNESPEAVRLWMPHWLYNVGKSFKAKGPPQPRTGNLAPQSDGVINERTAVTNGRGTIFQDPELCAQVYRAYTDGSRLLWNNIVSDVMPPPIGNVGDAVLPVEWFVTKDRYVGSPDEVENIKANYSAQPFADDAALVAAGYGPPGSFKLKQNITGHVMLNYSTYTGATITTNMPFDAWPMWRDIYPQETLSAFDSLFWALDAYKTMYECFVDKDPVGAETWRLAYRATLQNIEHYGTLIGANDIWIENLNSREATSETGTDHYSVPDLVYYDTGNQYEQQPGPNPTWDRDATDGAIRARLLTEYTVPAVPGAPGMSFHHYAFSANTLFFSTTATTKVHVRAKSSQTQTIVMELRGQKDYDAEQLYFYEVDLNNDDWTEHTINLTEFAKYQHSLWRPGVSCKVIKDTNSTMPEYAFSTQPIRAGDGPLGVEEGRCWSISGEVDGAGGYCELQFYPDPKSFGQACLTKFPIIWCRRGEDTTLMHVIIQGKDGETYTWVVPESDDIRRYDLEALMGNPGVGVGTASSAFKIAFVRRASGEIFGNNDVDMSMHVWKIRPHPDDRVRFPAATGEVWVAGIKSYLWQPHTLKIGHTYLTDVKEKSLKYNPGVTPFTVDLVNGSLKQWRGSPYVGYQSGEIWVDGIHLNTDPTVRGTYVDKADNLWDFYRDAQAHYAATAEDAEGPFSPVFLWPRWEDIRSEDPQGEFSWEGADPNTGWGGYMARAYYEAAKMLFLYRHYNVEGLCPTYAPTVVFKALKHFKNFMVANGNKPIATYVFTYKDATKKEATVSPEADYAEPHAMALVVRAAMYLNMSGQDREWFTEEMKTVTSYIITHGLRYVMHVYNRGSYKVGGLECAQGSFNIVYATDDPKRNHDGFAGYGFHNAEIVQTLALLHIHLKEISLVPTIPVADDFVPQGEGQPQPEDPTDPTDPTDPEVPTDPFDITPELALQFEQMAAYVGRYTTATPPMLIRSTAVNGKGDGLTAANLHSTTSGVYAPDESGTSESQFILAYGLLHAYRATQDEDYLDRGIWLLESAIRHMFVSGLDPADQYEFWVPHWLYVVKAPVNVQDHSTGATVAAQIGDRINIDGGWKTMPPTGANGASDAMQWAAEAFYAAYEATQEARWLKCARAISRSAKTASEYYSTTPISGAGASYIPGVVPFTINTLGGAMVYDYRGPYYTGYQSALPWIIINEPLLINQFAQFMLDAQNDYNTKRGLMGPFSPVFYGNRSDMTSYGTAGTFGWAGPDGNTSWGGFQYRAMEQCMKAWSWMKARNMTIPTNLKTVCNRITDFMKAQIDANDGKCPNSFPATASPSDYNVEAHGTALALRTMVYAVDVMETTEMTAKAQACVQALYAGLQTKYITATAQGMDGAFSQNPGNKEDYSFWHGEELSALAQSVILGVSLTSGSVTPVNEPPTFVSALPATGGTITVDGQIRLTFSKSIVKGTGNIVLKRGGSVYKTIDINSSEITITGANLFIDPTGDIAYSSSYVLEWPAGIVKDSGDRDLAAAGSTAFVTGAEPSPVAGHVWAVLGGDQAAGFMVADANNSGKLPIDHFLDIYATASGVIAAGITRSMLSYYDGHVAGALAGQYTGAGSGLGNYDGNVGTKYWWNGTAPGAACEAKLAALEAALGSSNILDGVIITMHEELQDIIYFKAGGGAPWGNAFLSEHQTTMTGLTTYLRTRFGNPDLRIGVQQVPPRMNTAGDTQILVDQRNALLSPHTGSWVGGQGNKTKEFGYIDPLAMTTPYLIKPSIMTAASQDLAYTFGNAFGTP